MTFTPLKIALLTVSDTRNEETDQSGKYLAEQITLAGHTMAEKKIILPDDIYQIRALISRWIADSNVQAIVISGGTGLTGRDGTPEAIKPLLDKEIDGFGELFRMLSFNEIKTSTIQSRALGGIANATFIFCIPGSPGACRTAWEGILKEQLDSRNKPCNFVELIPRLREI